MVTSFGSTSVSYTHLIFSGTETRKPLGYASVAITLDNSDHKLNVDFEEVTVTRRLYRSGESLSLIHISTGFTEKTGFSRLAST